MGLSSCAASRQEGFSPSSSMDALPIVLEGCTATLLMGIPPWKLQEGLGCRKISVTLPGCQDFVPCWGHQGRAQACLLTAGTPCKLCSHPISWASQISGLILLVQELHYPALRKSLAWEGQGIFPVSISRLESHWHQFYCRQSINTS